MVTASIARVLIESPLPQLDRLFDYRIPESMLEDAVVGCRVRVPLRSAGRIADGFLIEITDTADFSGQLSELDAVISPAAVLADEVYRLARRVADRAAGNASDVIRLAVPKRQVRVERAWRAAEPPAVIELPGTVVTDFAVSDVDDLVAHAGRVAMEAPATVVEVNGTWVGRWALAMGEVASRALHRGPVILVLPDYRDQEQVEIVLSALLPQERIVRIDSRQSSADRYRAHLACLDGTARVIIGNRSAVYAPAKGLALIAIWNDGDPLLSEPLSPYVHARDSALVRQEQQDCALVFLSHARTAEVERLVQLGWCTELTARQRIKPKVIPTTQQSANDDGAARARIPSTAWREATLALKQGPVLIQVARPGYAPQLVCESCESVAKCAKCQGPLGLKISRSAPNCGWCGAIAAPWSCLKCQGTRYRLRGQGATRTAEDLGRAFPGVPIIIADGERTVLRVEDRPSLVIATRGAEPIAAGGYRAVLLLDGERMLAREGLRVVEDCLRWWTSAIALTAAGAPSLLVGVEGPLAIALATWQWGDIARRELADRRHLRFPPAVRVATVTGDAASVERAVASVSSVEGVDVLGPVDAGEGGLRAIVRFDYGRGDAVTAALKAELVRNSTTRRRRVPAAGSRSPMPTLKVRCDDLEPFEQL